MEGTAAIRVETASENAPLPAGQDPMESRWGINPVVRDKIIDVEKAGFTWLPFGKFFPVSTFSTTEAIHTVDDNPNLPREHRVQRSAESAQMYLASMVGGMTENGHPDPTRTDWGVKFGFFGEKDVAKMAVIDSVLLPNLSTIGKKCPSTDPLEDRETCPTCWLQWLESDGCVARMQTVAESGVNVEVFDRVTGTTSSRAVTPTLAEFEAARALVIEALQIGLKAARGIWSSVAVELREKVRKTADAYQNNIRKDVHADRPEDDNLAQIRELARVQQAPAASDNAAVLAGLAKSVELLTQVVLQQGGGVPVPASVPAPVGTPVFADFGEFGQCAATTAAGTQCKNKAEANGFCKNPAHQPSVTSVTEEDLVN